MTRNTTRKVRWPRSLAVIAVASLIVINELGYRRATDAADTMLIEQQRRATLHAMLQQLAEAESARREFVRTGTAVDFTVYRDTVAQADRDMQRIGTLYAEDTANLTQLAALRAAVVRARNGVVVDTAISPSSTTGQASIASLSDNAQKKEAMELRNASNQMIATIAQSIEITQRQIDRSLSMFRVGAALAALLGLLSFVLYLRQTDRLDVVSESRRKRLVNERDQLEALVKERTSRLTVLANHLQNVQESERENLARELHDELGALLTAAKLDVARIRSKLPEGNEPLRLRLEHLIETLNSVIALKREIVENLRPSSLSNLGLVAALDILVREFSANTGVQASSKLDEVELDGEAQLTLYRVTQESLTNVSRYAKATSVSVTLSSHDGSVELVVADNGVGFDLQTQFNRSHGFAGMLHRVEALRGEFTVITRPRHGVRVSARLPKKHANSARSNADTPNDSGHASTQASI